MYHSDVARSFRAEVRCYKRFKTQKYNNTSCKTLNTVQHRYKQNFDLYVKALLSSSRGVFRTQSNTYDETF